MDKIIKELFDDKDLNIFVSKLKPIENQQDFKQQAFLLLLSKGDEFIGELYKKKEVKPYLLKTISNVRYDFLRKQPLILTDVFEEIECEDYSELHINTDGLYWYDKEILKQHLEIGAVKLSIKTKIPLTSIYETLNKIKKNIKNGKINITEKTV